MIPANSKWPPSARRLGNSQAIADLSPCINPIAAFLLKINVHDALVTFYFLFTLCMMSVLNRNTTSLRSALCLPGSVTIVKVPIRLNLRPGVDFKNMIYG